MYLISFKEILKIRNKKKKIKKTIIFTLPSIIFPPFTIQTQLPLNQFYAVSAFPLNKKLN